MKVQYNSLTMLLSSFMHEFGPISSRVYCIFAQITNNKLSYPSVTRTNAQFKHCYTRDEIGPNSCINRNQHS